jgi:hypothetical protein
MNFHDYMIYAGTVLSINMRLNRNIQGDSKL